MGMSGIGRRRKRTCGRRSAWSSSASLPLSEPHAVIVSAALYSTPSFFVSHLHEVSEERKERKRESDAEAAANSGQVFWVKRKGQVRGKYQVLGARLQM